MIGFHVVDWGRHLWTRRARQGRQDARAIAAIRRHTQSLAPRSDRALRHRAAALRQSWPARITPTPQVIAESFSLMCEAVRRTLGMTLYDVQLRAGLAMARHAIAEMQTGEGKTLAAALPAVSYGLAGRGVHVMTVNDYLAQRDCQLLRPAFELLGVSVGLLQGDASPQEKRAAYMCDVTYGPGHEFGFDYLRDQLNLMTRTSGPLGSTFRRQLRDSVEPERPGTQRGHFFAVIDEADSVMIDEANTPLVLANQGRPSACETDLHGTAMRVASELQIDRDFVVDDARRVVHLTRQGADRVNRAIDRNVVDHLQRPWPEYVRTALHAKLIFQRNVDYVVAGDVVKLVDGNTGRVFSNRSWRDGLRQAVEVYEGIAVTSESETVARIPRQRCFMLYDGLCGLTGTASESARELRDVYELPVVPIPPRLPSRRRVLPTRFFLDQASKCNAIAAEVGRLHAAGQPVLIGARTVEDSQSLARRLTAIGVTPQLLNGIQDADEASVIARAGQVSAITVATNMAGRGTDIRLGPGVERLGGLHVIACEPHESTRVDRQLIGRAARQGDPGSCQMFVAADDRLITVNSTSLVRQMQRSASRDGELIADFSAQVARLQLKLERRAVAARKALVAHDDWLEKIVLQMNR